MQIHHYGFATKNIEKSMEAFRRMGYDVSDVVVDQRQKVKISFVKPPSGPSIELICDLEENGPTNQYVNKMGCGFYHVCFEVDDIKQSTERLTNEGYALLHRPVEAVALESQKIVWLYNQYVGLIELVEKKPEVK